MGETLSSILSILAALLVLSLLVMVHELGHFGMGRLLGFSIQEFSIGMGPKIFKKQGKRTLFTIRALPIGGMCRFDGEDEAPTDELSFNAQKPWKRFLVVAAGPLLNLLFAFVFAVLPLSLYGNLVPMVAEISGENSPAQMAGLEEGDLLLAIDGKKVYSADAAVKRIAAVDDGNTVITISRGGEKQDIFVENIYNEEQGRNVVGVMLTYGRMEYTFFQSIGESFSYITATIGEYFGALGNMVTNGVQEGDVMGPVGTIGFISYAVRFGPELLMQLIIVLNISLAVMNLLPLPALDGGRLVFIAVEGIRRKPISQEIEGRIHFVGLMLLFGLIILLTFTDIRSMVN